VRRRAAAAAFAAALAAPVGGALGVACGRAADRRGEREAPSASAAAAAPASPVAAVREIPNPAAAGSSLPALWTAHDGRLLLSWVEPHGEAGHALRFAVRPPGGAWGRPLTIAEGRGWFVNWADFPHIGALEDGTLFAHWLARRTGGTAYDYDVRLTRSRDGGKSWEKPVSPYRDEAGGEHGFVALAPLGASGMGVLFLDGRETKDQDGAMTLRFAAVGRDGRPELDTRVDARVCDCCQTALARTSRGLVAAYRDRSASEVRDIAVVRFEAGRWSDPVFPGGEGWQIHACPVNGPALAAAGDRVALAWFTMAGETPRVKLAFSSDAGASWGPPQVVDDGRPIGRVDVVLPSGPGGGGSGDSSAIVSWLEQTEAGASLRVRRVAPGRAAPSLELAGTSAARSSGFPRVAHAGGELVVAWRGKGEPGRLVTAVVALP
jgi:hypothetical protein